jgi:hypothetical protein
MAQRGADFAGEHFVKVVTREPHFGVTYHEGRVTDPLAFNTDPTCEAGGLYFCRLCDVGSWINFFGRRAYAVYDVALDEDEPVVRVGDDKFKAHSIVLSGFRTIWDNKDLCLAAVAENCSALHFVINQTPEMCLAAVKQEGMMLHCVTDQTPEICLSAVEQEGFALQYVDEQTREICLAAIYCEPHALEFVEKQTPELCLAAVQLNGWTLVHVKEQTPELCLAAIKCDGCALIHVENQTADLCIEAVRKNRYALKYVKDQTPEIVAAAKPDPNDWEHYDDYLYLIATHSNSSSRAASRWVPTCWLL